MTKEEAIKQLDWMKYRFRFSLRWEQNKALDMAIDALKERLTGKWKDYGICVMDIGDVQELVCSECGATTFWADYYPLPFMPRHCHNCGARFEGAVDMAKDEEYRF